MFIFLESDNFEQGSRQAAEWGLESQHREDLKEWAAIRRPYRGIQIKKDTYATISVRSPGGSPLPLVSSSAVGGAPGQGLVAEYSDFILQGVVDSRAEKTQIIETFGETYAYFYGEKPRFLKFNGLLMNTEDFNWRAQFWHNYETFFRGSKLVEKNARLYLAYDTIVVEGYAIEAIAQDDSDDPYSVPFTVTMLLTNYHEYSTVGATKFPGIPADSLDVLNDELEKRRQKFVSTTGEVRMRNLNSALSTQIPKENTVLGIMRKGIAAWNSAATWLGDKIDVARRLYGGRTLRVPIGAAAYLAQNNDGELASASLTSSGNILSTGLAPTLQAAVGESFGEVWINGVKIPGNKLRVMGPVKFAPGWVSDVTGSSRGMIWESYDEYPQRTQPQTLADLANTHTKAALDALEDKRRARIEKATEYQRSLAMFNTVAAQGDVLGTIADAVSAFRLGYGMLLTAANVIADPFGVAAQAMGISPQQLGGVFNAIGQAAQGNFKPLGQGLVSYVPGVSHFLGEASRSSWEKWKERVEDQDLESLFLQGDDQKGVAYLGEVYNEEQYDKRSAAIREGYQDVTDSGTPADTDSVYGANDYVRAGGGEADYDAVYGDSNYQPLIDQQEAQDAETLAQEGDLPEDVDRTEPNAGKVEDSIDEVYGNTDDAAYGEGRDEPETIEDVYGGGGTITKTRPTAEERAAMLAAVYGGNTDTQTEDTSGITTSDDDSAPIDPVV